MNKSCSKVNHRITRENSRFTSFFHTLLRWFNEFLGNHTTNDLRYEFKPCARFGRFQVDHNVTILSLTTALTSKFALNIGDSFANCFTVSDLRCAHVSFNAKLTLHPINENFKVKFSHARNNRLIGFRISHDAESGIFFRK